MTTSEIQSEIISQSNSIGVPANIALAVARRESGLNPDAIGSSGEIGIFQLMPATANMLNVDPFDSHQNIYGGISLLSIEYKRFGNWTEALAAYNAGSPAVTSGKIPSSTMAYVKDVLAAAGYGVTESFDSTEPTISNNGMPTFSTTVWGKKYVPWALMIIGGFLILDYVMD